MEAVAGSEATGVVVVVPAAVGIAAADPAGSFFEELPAQYILDGAASSPAGGADT